jgi:hypothetical protein
MTYDYLRERINGDTWLSKPVLGISSFVNTLFDSPLNYFSQLAPIQAIANNGNLSFLLGELDNGLVTDMGLLLLESGYGVNKAYNSKKYDGRLLSQAQVLKWDMGNEYFTQVNKANDLLGELDTKFQEIAQPLDYSTADYIEAEKTKNRNLIQQLLDKAQNAFDSVVAQIQAITGEVSTALKKNKRKAQNKLNHFKRMMAAIKGNEQGNPKFVGSPIVPVTGTTISVVKEIATWLLTNFLGVNVATGALGWVVSSMVVKYIGAMGAEVARYFAAGLFKTVTLPTVLNPTGLFGGCWAFCQAFAPYLVIAAVITILLLRSQNTTGEYLHVFGLGSGSTAYASAKLRDVTGRLEIIAELKGLGKLILDESARSFDSLVGFAVDENDVPAIVMNLNTDIVIYKKPAIAAAIQPFMPIIRNGIDWQEDLAMVLGSPDLAPIQDPDWEPGNLFDVNDSED